MREINFQLLKYARTCMHKKEMCRILSLMSLIICLYMFKGIKSRAVVLHSLKLIQSSLIVGFRRVKESKNRIMKKLSAMDGEYRTKYDHSCPQ